MGKKLTKNVYVDGVLHKAGSSPDKAVADQITNPNAWDGEVEAADADDAEGDADAAGEKPKKRTARKSTS